jgi:hypothetical protein
VKFRLHTGTSPFKAKLFVVIYEDAKRKTYYHFLTIDQANAAKEKVEKNDYRYYKDIHPLLTALSGFDYKVMPK